MRSKYLRFFAPFRNKNIGTQPAMYGRHPKAEKKAQAAQAAEQSFLALSMPTRTMGKRDPPPETTSGRMHSVRLRFRKLSGSTVTITGDCIANLLGYQTTSAVVNRLAQTIRLSHIEIWAGAGAIAASAADDEPGSVSINFVNPDSNVDAPVISKSFTDTGTPKTSAHLSIRPPLNMTIDCTRANRWILCQIAGPTGTIVDVTLEYGWYQRGIDGPYTLTGVIPTVGLSPYNSYLDNTNTSGAAGGNLLARLAGVVANDFSAYG